MQKEIGKVFDVFSEGYSKKMIRFVPFYKEMLHAITHYLAPEMQPERILELGCGNGNLTAQLINKFPEAKIIAIDASAEMIQVCKKRFSSSKNIIYKNAFFQELQWAAKEYDLIVAGLSLHHLESEEKKIIFKKIFKSLTDRGVYACADLMIEKGDKYHESVLKEWKEFMIQSKSSTEEWEWIMDHYEKYDRPNSFENQIKWLQEANFQNTILSWNRGPWSCYHSYKS